MSIPKLRFPEFTKDWKEEKFKELFSIGGGKDYKHLNKGTIPVYGSGGIMTYVDDYIYDGETVCIGRKGTIDKPMYLKGKFWNVDTLFYTKDFKNINIKFLFYIFKQTNWLKYNQSGGVPSLSKKNIEKIKTFYPINIEEQEKIAEFINTVDTRINQLQKKKELLEEYKKGVVQQIFSQKIRFKKEDGSSYEDWEETSLKKLVDIKTGKKDVNESDKNGKYHFFSCAKKHTYSNTYSYDFEAILIAGNGEVGECKYFNGKFEAYQRTYILSNISINSIYLYQYMKELFSNEAKRQKQQGAMPYIKLGTLETFKIKYPSNIKEQEKIANFLQSLTKQIEQVDKQIEETKTFKKGLLQQMFV